VETVSCSIPAQSLRLAICPGCDYSLQTLPPQGVCPECGRHYDQRFIVLSGQGRGWFESSPGGTWRGPLNDSIFVVILILIVVSGHAVWREPNLLMWGVIGIVALTMRLYVRLFSAREPRMQLWISPDGIAQVQSTPEARQAQWVAHHVMWLFCPVSLLILVVLIPERLGAISFFLIAVIVALTFFFYWRAWKRRGDLAALDYIPQLSPWTTILKIDFQTLSRDRLRVRCRKLRSWKGIAISHEWIIDIELPDAQLVAEPLRALMLQWHEPSKAAPATTP